MSNMGVSYMFHPGRMRYPLNVLEDTFARSEPPCLVQLYHLIGLPVRFFFNVSFVILCSCTLPGLSVGPIWNIACLTTRDWQELQCWIFGLLKYFSTFSVHFLWYFVHVWWRFYSLLLFMGNKSHNFPILMLKKSERRFPTLKTWDWKVTWRKIQ